MNRSFIVGGVAVAILASCAPSYVPPPTSYQPTPDPVLMAAPKISGSQLCQKSFWQNIKDEPVEVIERAVHLNVTSFDPGDDACRVPVDVEGQTRYLQASPYAVAMQFNHSERTALKITKAIHRSGLKINPLYGQHPSIFTPRFPMVVDYLLKNARSEIEPNRRQSLLWLTIGSNREAAKLVVDAGFDPNRTRKYIFQENFEPGTWRTTQNVALADPAAIGAMDVIENLMAAGARDVPGTDAERPSEIAQRAGQFAAAKALGGGAVAFANNQPTTTPQQSQPQRSRPSQRSGCTIADIETGTGRIATAAGSPPRGTGTQLKWQKRLLTKSLNFLNDAQRRCPNLDLNQQISYVQNALRTTNDGLRAVGLN